MRSRLWSVIEVAAALGAAVNAGVFFAFSSFVMPGLATLDATQGAAAMQALDRAVAGSAFLWVFMATSGVCLVLLVRSALRRARGDAATGAGALACLVGMFLITAVINVPLNEGLSAMTPDAAAAHGVWAAYLRDWTGWNTVRAASAAIASLLFIAALLVRRPA